MCRTYAEGLAKLQYCHYACTLMRAEAKCLFVCFLLTPRPNFLCGGHLVTDTGIVASEGFPTPYKPNSKCTWYITVSPSNVTQARMSLSC